MVILYLEIYFPVDIDLPSIPLADRKQSLEDINLHLAFICEKAKKAFKGMHIKPNYDTCKLLCEWRGKQVKVEVNQTKRGLVGGIAGILAIIRGTCYRGSRRRRPSAPAARRCG